MSRKNNSETIHNFYHIVKKINCKTIVYLKRTSIIVVTFTKGKMRIIIDLEVTNPEEVLKSHKGELVKLITDVLMSKEKKKRKVEKAVCEEIVKVLQSDLPRRLEEEMVKTNVKISIERTDSSNDFMV